MPSGHGFSIQLPNSSLTLHPDPNYAQSDRVYMFSFVVLSGFQAMVTPSDQVWRLRLPNLGHDGDVKLLRLFTAAEYTRYCADTQKVVPNLY